MIWVKNKPLLKETWYWFRNKSDFHYFEPTPIYIAKTERYRFEATEFWPDSPIFEGAEFSHCPITFPTEREEK